MIWERFRKKKEEVEIPAPRESTVRDELFELKDRISPPLEEKRERVEGYPSFPTFEIGKTQEERPREEKSSDLDHKIEMILTKIELINERLKVIEEKIERRGY